MRGLHGKLAAGLVAALATAGCAAVNDGGAPAAPAVSGSTPAAAAQPAARPEPLWVPSPGDAWQWQLTGDLDLDVDVPI